MHRLIAIVSSLLGDTFRINLNQNRKKNKMIDKDIIMNLVDIEISCLELVSLECNFETQADIEKELYRIAGLCKTISNELKDKIQEKD